MEPLKERRKQLESGCEMEKYKARLTNGEIYYDIVGWCRENEVILEDLPFSIRLLLENAIRNYDGKFFTGDYLKRIGNWSKDYEAQEIPFLPSRILLQDLTGVPAVVDLAAMRQTIKDWGGNPKEIHPQIPVDLVIDHSVSMDFTGDKEALSKNVALEFERNAERYRFLKWAESQLENFRVYAPGQGICHQVNLEKIATVVSQKDGICFPDTVVGTDSHTTMVNGLGVLGWGVGGIEAEAAMLGQPIYILNPEVVGVRMSGKVKEGVSATDIVLHITNLLRKVKVVGKFVEYFGEGAESLSVPDRATISNMAPEYGATMGFFAVDEKTLEYLHLTGRKKERIALVREYCMKNGLFRSADCKEPSYSQVIELNLSEIVPALAGPKRPQDLVQLSDVRDNFVSQYPAVKVRDTEKEPYLQERLGRADREPEHGDIVLASITSCTNTSNPQVILGAGLLAKKAVERGLRVPGHVKTSFSPGSLAVTRYLKESGLLPYLEKLGFHVAGYGCGSCIGNSGPLSEKVSNQIKEKDLQVASVLSGNRNFEGRIHPLIPANYLASPMLVVAFALAGRIDIDLHKEAIGMDASGKPVYYHEICPSNQEVEEWIRIAVKPEVFLENQSAFLKEWEALSGIDTALFLWDENSTYVRRPNFFDKMKKPTLEAKCQPLPLKKGEGEYIKEASILGILGDSVTTDHISPAGSIALQSPAANYLRERGVESQDFNSYGSRRGNHEVMMRGTFANIRLRNQMAEGKVGGYTKKDGEIMTIYDAAVQYQKEKKDLIMIAGKEYGTGSSRDWAAKGPMLLGVKGIIAESFERIHRSNLLGMGILPMEFIEGQSADSWHLDGTETISVCVKDWSANSRISVIVTRRSGEKNEYEVKSRLDNEVEIEYFLNGGILNTVLINKWIEK